jgi:SAM-dependent methyltransferase
MRRGLNSRVSINEEFSYIGWAAVLTMTTTPERAHSDDPMRGDAQSAIKRVLPWFVKIPAKIVLSRLPVSLRAWQKLNLFRAGAADSPAFHFGVFHCHLAAYGNQSLQGKTVLEIGPGNGLLTALFARILEADHSWLVDQAEIANDDWATFEPAAEYLRSKGLNPPAISRDEPLASQLRYTYLTRGLDSMRQIPSSSIDFLFSQAVMEHVRLAEFDELAREMRRVLKPSGAASHWIDFRDHLQYALNNLRFSEKVWESRFMASSGFYTNRIPFPAMQRRFRNAGFSVRVVNEYRWPSGLPTAQSKMAPPYRGMSPGELMVQHAHVVLYPAEQPASKRSRSEI